MDQSPPEAEPVKLVPIEEGPVDDKSAELRKRNEALALEMGELRKEFNNLQVELKAKAAAEVKANEDFTNARAKHETEDKAMKAEIERRNDEADALKKRVEELETSFAAEKTVRNKAEGRVKMMEVENGKLRQELNGTHTRLCDALKAGSGAHLAEKLKIAEVLLKGERELAEKAKEHVRKALENAEIYAKKAGKAELWADALMKRGFWARLFNKDVDVE